MITTGNTILVTGGGSGIGRRLAEAFYELGNVVIVAGRRQQVLDEVTAANPGMKSAALDIEDPRGVREFGAMMARDYPALNAVLHSAGVMRPESIASQPDDLADVESTVATNLLGPIRLTAALLPLLRRQSRSAILTVSSGLAFVPRAMAPTYCATKAAIHSYTLSLRHQLRGTTTEVIEVIPPYVQTHLMGQHQADDPEAMPLADYLQEVMRILTTQSSATEVVVERCKPLRFAAKGGGFDATFEALNRS